LSEVTPKAISHGNSRKKNSSPEKLCKHRYEKTSISPLLSSVPYELQNMFPAVGVVRNHFFGENSLIFLI